MPSVGTTYRGRPLDELKKLCKRVDNPEELTAEDLKRFNCFRYKGQSYAASNYEILSEPHKMTPQEWVEVVDNGAINFGGRVCGRTVTVYID